MSVEDRALLLEHGVTDSKSWRTWLLRYHPDKNPGDEKAGPLFAKMHSAWKSKLRTPAAAPRRRRRRLPSVTRDLTGRCTVIVRGPRDVRCSMTGTPTCFYHMPGTDHLKYCDGNPSIFFSVPRDQRDATMCTRKSRGRWCTSTRHEDTFFCLEHAQRKPVV
jgi:hypothetical protein